MDTKKSSESLLLKLALAGALAASAGYAYFTHKEEIDSAAKKRLGQLAKTFRQSKAEVEKRVKKIWGTVNKEAVAAYLDVRANLLHALENEKIKKGEKILKVHYEQLVDNVLQKARKAGLLKIKNHEDLAKILKTDWLQVQKAMAANAKTVGKVAQKSLAQARSAAGKAGSVMKKAGHNAAKKAQGTLKKLTRTRSKTARRK